MNNTPDNSDRLSFEIRAAVGRTEFRKFRGLNQLAGVPNVERSARLIWLAYKTGLLSSALSADSGDVVEHAWATAGLRGAVITRSVALVAVSHGEVIGGLSAGPSSNFIRPLAGTDRAAVLHAVLATVKIHVLAVLPEYERNGIGRALIQHTVDTYTAAGAAVVYGQVVTNTGNARFYRRCGFTVHPVGNPLLFTSYGIPLALVAERGESLLSLKLSREP